MEEGPAQNSVAGSLAGKQRDEYRARMSLKRGLSADFLSDLQTGRLSAIAERVRADRTLCVGIRADCINVYYRGGNLLRVHIPPSCRGRSGVAPRYEAWFDENYFTKSAAPTLPKVLTNAEELQLWLDAIPTLKDAMDRSSKLKVEREIQQAILRDNNFCNAAQSTDYYVCDIEYACDIENSKSRGRFDFVGVEWLSKSHVRKRDRGHRLIFGEVKQGEDALEGDSGLHKHIRDVDGYLANPGAVDAIKAEMITVFNQKRTLGLHTCKKDLVAFGDDPPLLILVLVNHDPEASRLGHLLRTLPERRHLDLRIATSSLTGYGLYEPCLMTVESVLDKFGDRIR